MFYLLAVVYLLTFYLRFYKTPDFFVIEVCNSYFSLHFIRKIIDNWSFLCEMINLIRYIPINRFIHRYKPKCAFPELRKHHTQVNLSFC